MEQGLIVIVDYGMGNLASIAKALTYVGGRVLVSADPRDLTRAARMVLPGVGAFGDGMRQLRERGLVDALEQYVMVEKKPFLGVCLGMQLLATSSEEFGMHAGLGWIPGDVRRLGVPAPLKVPHVGWNTVTFTREHPLLDGVPLAADFYFVHSYAVVPEDTSVAIGTVSYGTPVVSAIAFENIFATQFHPEKSQKDGLRILENFITWQPTYA